METQEKYPLEFNVPIEVFNNAIHHIRRMGYPSGGALHIIQENREASFYYVLGKSWRQAFSLAVKIKLADVESSDFAWVSFWARQSEKSWKFLSNLGNSVEAIKVISDLDELLGFKNEKNEAIQLHRTSCLREEIALPTLNNLKPVIQMRKGLLKDILLSTSFAMSEEDGRGALYGIHLEKVGHGLLCVATDGTIITEKRIPLTEVDLFELKTLNLNRMIIERLMFALEGNSEDLVTLSLTADPEITNYKIGWKTKEMEKEKSRLTEGHDERFMVIQTDNLQFIFVDSYGYKFPEYRKFLDQEKGEVATVSSFELEKALVELGKGKEWLDQYPFYSFLQGKEGDLLVIDDAPEEDQKILEVKGLEGSGTENDYKIYLNKRFIDSFLFTLTEDQPVKISLSKETNNARSLVFLETKNAIFGVVQAVTGERK